MNYRDKALKAFKALIGAILMILIFEPKVLIAQGPGTLLYDHFGVTLLLQSPHSGGTNYSFDWNSFAPTLNTGTADYVESDWYGDWNFSAFGDGTSTIQHTPAPGTADLDYYPSGDEPYDVEAIYLDDDLANIYVVIVTSFPHYVAANSDVGLVDPRISASAALVRPGDLSINLFSGSPRSENNNTEWHYNYGVDVTHENRDNIINVGGYETRGMRDNALGNTLYKTNYDVGGSNILNPTDSDWYTSLVNGVVEAYWEHTNFDPFSTQSTPTLIYQGNVTTNYYEYDFGGGLQENGHPTYVYEFTIPRSLLGNDDPCTSDPIGIRWVEGCRNDGNGTTRASFLVGAIDYCDPPLPVTLSSFTASEINREVQLNWITESEIENQGFIIERRQDDEPWQEISSFITNSELQGQGTVTYSTKYEYIDKFVYPSKTYEYRLGDIDYNGVVTFHATESIKLVASDLIIAPKILTVKPAFPNPFNPSTLIEYALPEGGYVTVEVFDVLGNKIISLVNDYQTAGWHSVRWNGTNNKDSLVPAGMYLGIISSNTRRETIKLMYVK